jgi:hypothetical protein
MIKHIIFSTLFFTTLASAEMPTEMYMPTEAGGFITLTLEGCQFHQAVNLGLLHRATSSESNGVLHEGCWDSPSIAEAPKHPGIRIIPVVNTWWEEDQQITTFRTNQFSPEKKRWDEKPIKGDI